MTMRMGIRAAFSETTYTRPLYICVSSSASTHTSSLPIGCAARIPHAGEIPHHPEVAAGSRRPLDSARAPGADTGYVMETIRLFLVDDEKTIRQGLRMRLEMESDFEVVGEAADGLSALANIPQALPDVVLMDVELPGIDGICAAKELRLAAPACAVVMLSMHDDVATRTRASAAGAIHFVAKHEIDAVLTNAVRSAASRRGRE